MTIADFNPSILFLLLWGLLSWFTKKKKKEAKEVEPDSPQTVQKKEDIFARLKKLQDHLASNVDILPLRPEEEYWEEEKTEVFGELEPELVQEPAMVYPEKEEVAWDGSTPILPKSSIKMDQRNWLSTIMGDGNHIKKALILNEILGKPRGLRPY
jgi:hypothetical protein